MPVDLPAVGSEFQGRYLLQRVLGEGGYARVFAATDTELRREVAIKVLRPSSDEGYQQQEAARFMREAKLVARLANPHIVQMFDYGHTDTGLMYAVFELVGGRDLTEVIHNEAPLPERTVIRILLQVLDALGEAHRNGLLHRDVKPDNIRVYEYMGDPLRTKLLDFGIAKPTHDHAGLTGTGMVIGTPRFMAPEQVYGEDLGPYTDIYALGLIAYEMLVGEPARAERALVHAEDIVVPEHVAGPELRGVIDRMMRPQVRDRYAATRPIVRDLRQVAKLYRTAADMSSTSISGIDLPSPGVSTSGSQIDIPMLTTLTEQQESDFERSATSRFESKARPARPMRHFIGFLVGAVIGGIVLWQLRASDPGPEPQTYGRPLAQAATSTPSINVEPPSAKPDADAYTPDVAVADDVGGALVGCGSDAIEHGYRDERAEDGLASIPWGVYVPRGYDHATPHPMVILFHDDHGSFARDVFDASSLGAVADEAGFVIVLPEDEAMGYPWTTTADTRQTEFVVQRTRERYCVDASRIFAIGYGAGSHGSERMACLDWIAGVALTSHAPERDVGDICKTPKATPMITILPDQSGHLPPDGGLDCYENKHLSFDEAESFWGGLNGCEMNKPPKRKVLGRSECRQWSCDQPYVSCRINGGRRWAGAPRRSMDVFRCDGPSTQFPHGEVIWKFFESLPPVQSDSIKPLP